MSVDGNIGHRGALVPLPLASPETITEETPSATRIMPGQNQTLCIEPCGGEARRKLRRATRRDTGTKEDGQVLSRVFLNPDSVAPPLSKYLEKFPKDSDRKVSKYKNG